MIYIFGHKNPDTDSICSSIALSYLKNKLGVKTMARASGHLNNETKFVLNYFRVTAPQYLNDVRIRVKNIKYNKKAIVNKNDSIFNAYLKMIEQNTTGVAIIDDDKKLVGFVSMKDVARYLISNAKERVKTTLDNVLQTINATTVVKFTNEIKGNVRLVGLKSSTLKETITLYPDDIVIIGDRERVVEYAIDSNVKVIILLKDSVIDNKLLERAKEKKITIIRSHLTSFEIATKIPLSNYVTSIMSNNKPVTVFNDDYYTDFQSIISKTHYTNYPVINHKNECLGLIDVNNQNKYSKQKVILVDHNNYSQSVVGIEEADIIEIIDHHNLGSIGTTMPINFRCKPVGCTSTVIYEIFNENKITIPKNIAGLMMSAIISDTLLFTSPSTTQEDRDAVEKLSKIAKVDVEKYGYEMIKASSSVKGLTINQQIYQDYKSYTVGSKQIGIGQLMTMDFDDIYVRLDEYVQKLEEIRASSDGVFALFITDIIKNGSYVLYDSQSENIIRESFNLDEIHQGIFLKGVVSRKKQMLPAIMEIMK